MCPTVYLICAPRLRLNSEILSLVCPPLTWHRTLRLSRCRKRERSGRWRQSAAGGGSAPSHDNDTCQRRHLMLMVSLPQPKWPPPSCVLTLLAWEQSRGGDFASDSPAA